MTKLVVLRLEGSVEQGFRVRLELGPQGERAEVELQGQLPAQPKLAQQLDNWQRTYRSIDIPTRLKVKEARYYTDFNYSSIDNCRQAADHLQDSLRCWLDSREFLDVNKQLREELNRDETIQILIRTEDEQALRLPWHLWDFVERYPKAEIAFSSSQFRRINRTRVEKNCVKILAILGNSIGIDVVADQKMLNSLPNAKVTFLSQPQRRELNDYLWSQAWDILFFAGHSETNGNKGRIYINAEDSLSIEELKYGLRIAIAQGLQLAIFNSCDGLGLAHELEQLHIPQMIVMRQPVPDHIAQEFLKQFLKAYAEQGETFYLAERRAREWLQGLEYDYPCATWLPAIFQNPAEIPPTWKELLNLQGSSTSAAKSELDDDCYASSGRKVQDAINSTAPLEATEDNSKRVPAPPVSTKDNVQPILQNLGPESAKEGIVLESIYPGCVGRVEYNASHWNACSRYPEQKQVIHEKERVTVVGLIKDTNILFVIPDGQKCSIDFDTPKFFPRSLLSSLLGRKVTG